MGKILRILLVIVFGAILVGAAFLGGYGVSNVAFPARSDSVDDGAPAEFRSSMGVFWEAWNLVQNQFYLPNKLDPLALSYGSVSGMVDSLGDPYTGFSDPRGAARLNSQIEGSFEGIGATIEMRSGRLTIVSPIKGSPAEAAGLKPNDIILKVNDTVIQNMTTDDAVNLIRGPKGTEVVLTIQRVNTPPFEVKIKRDKITVPFVDSKMLDNNIGYIRMSEFGATAAQELHQHLQTVLANKPKGIILDLRGNPGGFLDAAIQVGSEFLRPGQTVLVEQFKNGSRQELKTQNGGLAYDVPLVLLVNRGSASASEIISGALKDYKRATLIGTRTFGKGSVQNVNALSDQSQLRVTIAHFLSPKGNEIHEVGVSPDIEVPDPTDAEVLANKDPQLDRATQFLLSGASTPLPDRTWNWTLLFPVNGQALGY